MMAEQIANQVVKTADFGVADKIAKYFVRDGEDRSRVGHQRRGIDTAGKRALDAARSGTNEISRDFIRKMMQLADPDERG
jgi:hypothetical protein